MLIKRIITALFLIPIIFWLNFYAQEVILHSFLILIILAVSFEWSRMFGLETISSIFLFFLSLLFYIFGVYFKDNFVSIYFICILSLYWIFCSLCLLGIFKNTVSNKFFQFISGLFFAISFPLSFYYCHTNINIYFSFYTLLTVWLTDSGAYFAGRLFGKRLFLPKISPKKTWEGVVGGVVGAYLGYFLLFLMHGYINKINYFIITFVIVIFSVSGDLSESMFKRLAKVKDSGEILPGHGGVLDRIDSLSAAVPLAYLAHILLFKLF